MEQATEYFFGKWLTKDQFVSELNKAIGGRAGFVQRSHEDDILTLSIMFNEDKEQGEQG